MKNHLPNKREFVVCLNITPMQRFMYVFYLTMLIDNMVDDMASNGKRISVITAIHNLKRIWNHPAVEVVYTKDAQIK